MRSPANYFHFHHSFRNWTFIQVRCDNQSSQSTTAVLLDLQATQHSPSPPPPAAAPCTRASSASVPMDTRDGSYAGKRKAPEGCATNVPHQYIRINDDEYDENAAVPPSLPVAPAHIPQSSSDDVYSLPQVTCSNHATCSLSHRGEWLLHQLPAQSQHLRPRTRRAVRLLLPGGLRALLGLSCSRRTAVTRHNLLDG